MAKLAIKGHETRGKEVIEILEMLGGRNVAACTGANTNKAYVLASYGSIDIIDYVNLNSPEYYLCVFTLEEFLEKFPYKVGDKIIYHESESEIVSMAWDGVDVVYTVNHNDELWDTIAYNLQPYKEAPMYLSNSANKQAEEIEEILEPVKEIMEETDIMNHTTEINLNHPCFKGCNEIEIIIPDGWEFKQRDNKMFGVRKQYPKTYEECIGLLPINWDGNVEGYKCQLLLAFQKLLICRDAYWKIAGEEMRLDKPWVPDWNQNTEKYVIYPYQYLFSIDKENYRNTVLAFPTEEMRDAFYDNFKGLIEECKEFL